jgi:NADH-quinone oxidoreductase subunit K
VPAVLAIPLWWYLLVAAALFCIGLFGTLTRKNAINVLMGIELMLNAVNLNAVAFWRYVTPVRTVEVAGQPGPFLVGIDGQVFAVFVIALAAAEAAVGLAMVIAIYRSRRTVELDSFTMLQG